MNFREFLSLSKQDLIVELISFLQKSHYSNIHWDKEGNFIYAIGRLPVLVTAHYDTVYDTRQEITPVEVCYDHIKKIYWSPNGIAGDDKAGLWTIIKLINKGLKPSVLFLDKEERGSQGARAFLKDPKLKKSAANNNFILGFDRKNRMEAVFYRCKNTKFKKMIESYGFKTEIGSHSDIAELSPELKIAAANLSVGYYNNHREESEYIRYNDLSATIKATAQMLRQLETNKKYLDQTQKIVEPIIETQRVLPSAAYGNEVWRKGSQYSTLTICDFCGTKIPLNKKECTCEEGKVYGAILDYGI